MKAKLIKKYFVALLIVLAIDLTWLLVIMKSFYEEQLSGFVRPEIVPIWSAILAWALIPLGIVLFVDKLAKNNKQSLAYGTIYGFILYGLYDFTNYATLANWSLSMLIIDVIWGSVLCAITSLILMKISNKWIN